MGQLFGGVFGIAYFALGIVQWFAIIDGIKEWFNISSDFIAFFISGFLAYIPLVGTIAGFKGAMDAWHWTFLESAGLFFGVPIAILVISSVADR